MIFKMDYAILAAFSLILLSAPLMATPQRPGDVDARATYFSKTKVWFLTANGERSVWYSNGQLKARGPYKEGSRQGEWTYYHENGQKQAEGAYRDGKMTGKWTLYHSNGKKESEGNYKNNYKDGHWIVYDSNGNKSGEGNFTAGYKHGLWTDYYPGGGIFFKGEYVMDVAHGKWTYYYRNGQLYQSGEYNAEKRTGPWKICIQPGGPCGTESFSSPAAPRISGLSNDTTPASNTQDPADLLDSMEGKKDVPPSMEGKWSTDF
ncbi:MAG: toxin-antitoxin system YwqK family antitoxin [Leptospiraceae bacterium]